MQSGTNIIPQGTVGTPFPPSSASGAAVNNLAGYPGQPSPPYPTRASSITQQNSALNQGNANTPSMQSAVQNQGQGQGQGMLAYPTFQSGDSNAGAYPIISNPKGYGSSSSTTATAAAATTNNGNQLYGNSRDPYTQDYRFASDYGSPTKPQQFEMKDAYCDPPYYESVKSQSQCSSTNSNINSSVNSSKYYGESVKSESVYSDRANATRITVPPIPSSFTELQNLSSYQLEKLTKDDVAIHVRKLIVGYCY